MVDVLKMLSIVAVLEVLAVIVGLNSFTVGLKSIVVGLKILSSYGLTTT